MMMSMTRPNLRLLRELEPVLGFPLHVAKRISGCEKMRVQVGRGYRPHT